MKSAARRAAVLLSGNGVYDGSEIMETCAMLFSLHEFKFHVQCFAPNWNQMHVVNHLNGQDMKETRNVLIESARIARGDVKPLEAVKASEFDALVMPGGFGAAKNLSDFATTGPMMRVHPEVAKVIRDFHDSQKYIAACCISPVLLAKLINDAEITLGKRGEGWPYSGSIDAANFWGAKCQEKNYNEICHDPSKKLITAPAFMYDHKDYHEVYSNIRLMVKQLSDSLKH